MPGSLAVMATLATTFVLGTLAFSVPSVAGAWSVTISENPSMLPAGRNASLIFTFGNPGQDPITIWHIDVQFDWTDPSAWIVMHGPWRLADGEIGKAFIGVAVPNAVGSHTVREQVWANETGMLYPTVANYTQSIEIVSPYSVSVFQIDLRVALVAIAAAGIVGAVLILALRRRSGLPPQ